MKKSTSPGWRLISFLILLAGITGCSKQETQVPDLSIYPFTGVTMTSAQTGGLILSDGGAEVSDKGICYNTQPLPTLSGDHVSVGPGSGLFSIILTGLNPDTRYYVRGYATNEAGTAYSAQLILQTMYGTMTDRDSNIYQTVRIGDQVWMAENLRVTHFMNGAPIPNRTDYTQWAQVDNGAFCWYANDYEIYGQYYGALYNSYALTDPRGLCPDGWHIPRIGEWDTLVSQLGGLAVAGGKLKSAFTAYLQPPCWIPPNYMGTNESGFSAFPGGVRSYVDGIFTGESAYGYWWSVTPDTTGIDVIGLATNSEAVFRLVFNHQSGASVRLLQD